MSDVHSIMLATNSLADLVGRSGYVVGATTVSEDARGVFTVVCPLCLYVFLVLPVFGQPACCCPNCAEAVGFSEELRDVDGKPGME